MAGPRGSSHINEIVLLCTQHGQGRQGGIRKPLHVACTTDDPVPYELGMVWLFAGCLEHQEPREDLTCLYAR